MTNKVVYLYGSIIQTQAIAISVPVAELPNLEAAIQAGAWYSAPGNPNDHWNMAGIVRYTVQ